MPTVTMRQLLEAGVHFGHQTRRWNPKMRPFIFAERNGIHIIDLAQTVRRLDLALDFVREVVARGDSVLFVGTKKQAQEPVAEEASRAGMPYVNHRWLGGFLTNFVTIKKRLGLLEQLEAREVAGEFEWMTKKEASRVRDVLERLRRTLGGVRKMRRLPGAIFVIDPQRERIAVTEARKLEIPVVGTGDTNIDPDMLDFVIPANDDAIRAIRLLCRLIADASLQGAEERATRAEAVPDVETEVVEAEAASDEYMAALAAGQSIIFEPGVDEDEEEEDYLSLAPGPVGPAPRPRTRPEPLEEEVEVEEAVVEEAEPAPPETVVEATVPAASGPDGTGEPPAEALAEAAAEAALTEKGGKKAAPARPRRPAKAAGEAAAAKPAARAPRRRTAKRAAEEQVAEPAAAVEAAPKTAEQPAAAAETVEQATAEPATEPAAQAQGRAQASTSGAKRRGRR